MAREDWLEIRKRAKLVEYKAPPRKTLTFAEHARTVPKITGKTNIGSFTIHTRKTPQTCSIRVVENLPGGKAHVIGVWAGDQDQCKIKTREVAGVIYQVRAERGIRPGRPTATTDPIPKFLVKGPQGNIINKPVSYGEARDAAKSISTIQFDDISIVDAAGEVEETYKRGAQTFTRTPMAPVPLAPGYQSEPVRKEPKARKPKDIQKDVLAAAARGDINAILKLSEEAEAALGD